MLVGSPGICVFPGGKVIIPSVPIPVLIGGSNGGGGALVEEESLEFLFPTQVVGVMNVGGGSGGRNVVVNPPPYLER